MNEMIRVLANAGRVYINVPGKAGELFTVFFQEVENHICLEAAGAAGQEFTLNDTKELRQFMEQAGFKNIEVATREKMFNFPASIRLSLTVYPKYTDGGVVADAGEKQQLALNTISYRNGKNSY
ncbi:hypothetical protein DYD21_10370 [Rhodohalobacter sp. SW132]|nr:hypothetical protein DYD21_10370 [Rhodohalobacter sp. SW132]